MTEHSSWHGPPLLFWESPSNGKPLTLHIRTSSFIKLLKATLSQMPCKDLQGICHLSLLFTSLSQLSPFKHVFLQSPSYLAEHGEIWKSRGVPSITRSSSWSQPTPYDNSSPSFIKQSSFSTNKSFSPACVHNVLYVVSFERQPDLQQYYGSTILLFMNVDASQFHIFQSISVEPFFVTHRTFFP